MTLVPAEINVERPGSVLIVGRDPGELEVEAGRPFVGRAGELLDECLAEAGWRRQDVNITNVVPYRPPDNEFAGHDPRAVQQGIVALRALCERLQPALVIALGNEAAYSLIEGWPTRGNGIFGAQKIYERRGYFWPTPSGMVLTTLHPAGVLRQEMPGKWLLKADLRRAKRWMTLRRLDVFPKIHRLNTIGATLKLVNSRLVGWDIESKWGTSALLCSAFCSEDGIPYVAGNIREFQLYGKQILQAKVPKVGHNGIGFDVPAMRMWYDIKVTNYLHDTQTMWWALEPEISGTDQTSGEDSVVTSRRMTRKGLAFLASLYFTVPWWKNYPEPEHPDHDELMIELNGRDAWVTRELAGAMLREIKKQGVQWQYETATSMFPALVEMQLRGMPVDNTIRLERMNALEHRAESSRERSKAAAMKIIVARDLKAFREEKKCGCCGGGKTQREHCWKCAGPSPAAYLISQGQLKDAARSCGYSSIKALKMSWPTCKQCAGAGKIAHYDFNPFSTQQLHKLLYGELNVPQHTWKGKTMMDDAALKKILRWTMGK